MIQTQISSGKGKLLIDSDNACALHHRNGNNRIVFRKITFKSFVHFIDNDYRREDGRKRVKVFGILIRQGSVREELYPSGESMMITSDPSFLEAYRFEFPWQNREARIVVGQERA